MSKSTLPLTVRNTGFLLDRLGKDCAPLQFVRELTQNSIDAITKASVADARVVWDYDTLTLEDDGIYKLSISDNGPGMTGEEMIEYINSLSSSGSHQSIGGNYGVGAKIAAGTRNHHGLIYISWKNGKGSMIHLWRDPETGQYGLREIERNDGTFGHYGDVTDDAKPEWIKDHGTKVVLLGNSPEETTTIAPEGFTARDRWINKYLNTRYFRIRDGITISAREGMEAASKGGKLGYLRHVYGQAYFLGKAGLHWGVVDLEGARAHWWVVKERHELQTEGPSYETTGHIAALYQDELHEMLTQRAGRARLQEFGVIFGTNRVIIYVEPVAGHVTTNTARTRLIIDGHDLPWSDWAAEFRDKMPREIRELMDEVGPKALSNDHEKTIRDRLKPLMDLYRVSRYRIDPNGSSVIDDQNQTQGGKPNRNGTNGGGGGRGGTTGSRGGKAGGAYGNFLKDSGTPGKPIHPDVFPKWRWVSVNDDPPSRNQGDIEDRAARYFPEQNLLLINRDFRVFTDMVDRWAREFEGQAGARTVCEEVIRLWWEQTLVEAVIGIQALKESAEWPPDLLRAALSEEALTLAVMPRYHTNYAAKRDISSKLGRIQ
jgi:hypothetical protein